MTRRLLVFVPLLAWAISRAGYAQVLVSASPFDVPTDARGAGMGESLVALRSNVSALMYNPAGLAALSGMGLSYGERSMAWISMTEGFTFYGVNAFAETPIGVFAAHYNKFSQGEFTVTSSSDPLAAGKISRYSYDVALAYARNIVAGLDFGVAAKYYDDVFRVSGATDPLFQAPSTTPAWLFDGGLQYTFPGLSSGGRVEDDLTLGISVQNVGTKISYSTGTESESVEQSLPQYIHAGLAATVRLLGEERSRPAPLAATLTLEYTNVLNSSNDQGGSPFWGAGIEFVLGEIISLRGGAVVQPLTNIYGQEG
ncbi:MAG TPA: PorV/PorQ family protein, partial [Bacteroidota bacterium]|nr:PorV/PorQ family protein [Bacteroidota bacterium]